MHAFHISLLIIPMPKLNPKRQTSPLFLGSGLKSHIVSGEILIKRYYHCLWVPWLQSLATVYGDILTALCRPAITAGGRTKLDSTPPRGVARRNVETQSIHRFSTISRRGPFTQQHVRLKAIRHTLAFSKFKKYDVQLTMPAANVSGVPWYWTTASIFWIHFLSFLFIHHNNEQCLSSTPISLDRWHSRWMTL